MPTNEEILRILQRGGNPWAEDFQPANPMGTYIRGEPGAVNAADQQRVQASLAGQGYIPRGQSGFLPQTYAGQDEGARARLAADLAGKLLGAPISPANRAVALGGIRGEAGNMEDFMRDIEGKVGANLERKNAVTNVPYVPKNFRKEFSHIEAIPEKTGMGGTTIAAHKAPSREELAQYRAMREVWPVESAPVNRFLSSRFQRY